MALMLAPKIPLRLLSDLTPVDFPENNGTIFARKSAIQLALKNCEIIRDIGTDQMHINEPDLREDVHAMRVAALLAISLAESAVLAEAPEDFKHCEGEFRSQYAKVIASVQSFLWDAGPVSQRYLWPLVPEVM